MAFHSAHYTAASFGCNTCYTSIIGRPGYVCPSSAHSAYHHTRYDVSFWDPNTDVYLYDAGYCGRCSVDDAHYYDCYDDVFFPLFFPYSLLATIHSWPSDVEAALIFFS